MKKKIQYKTSLVFLILLLLAAAVSGCSGQKEESGSVPAEISATSEESESESSETSAALESSSEKESRTAESTEETYREVTEEDKTAAYKACLSFLRGQWDAVAEAAKAGKIKAEENVALSDIAFDALPELLLTRSDGGKQYFEIRDLGGDGSAEVLFSMRLPNYKEGSARCFFSIVDDRSLYEYEKTDGKETWYYYNVSDGSLNRTALIECVEKKGSDPQYLYLGEACSEEEYTLLRTDLISCMDVVLIYGPSGLFGKELSGAFEGRKEFGMDADRAIRFLYAAIPPETGGSDDFASVLRDYILNARYLVSGAQYVTGEGADEITFGLHDMNGDGVKELFISNGDPQFSYKTNHVYRFEDGNLIYCGDAGFRESMLWTAPGSAYTGVFCSGGHSGFVSHVYYKMQKDGTVIPETVTTHEDTTYKIENHDDKIVTEDYGLYEVCMANCPAPGREACMLQMVNAAWIQENGIESLIEGLTDEPAGKEPESGE